MDNFILHNRVDLYYKNLFVYSHMSGDNKAVLDRVREFDRFREDFWDEQEKKFKVKCIYNIPEWDKLDLIIVKKHKELFQWLKNWWYNCSKEYPQQRMFETAYAYLVDEGCFGYIKRWKEIK